MPADERTGLIASGREQERYGGTVDRNGSKAESKPTPTPLDMGQVVVLTLARISEPLTFTILFPFVQQMIVDTGEVAVEDVGYSVGMIEVAFSITQCLSLLYWSRAADTHGRKPVLLVSLLGACVAVCLFGFSKHVWQMYACRFLAGVFGGNAMVIRTLYAEVSDRTNQAKAFAYFAFGANIGALLGPALGGFLSNPAAQWPNVFGRYELLQRFPYALPCIICGLYCFLTFILSALFLKETRPDECDTPLPIRKVLNKRTLRMLGIFGWTVAVAFSLSATFPLYLFTPISIGGQGQTPPEIAKVQASAGLAQALWLLFAMPRLDAKLGTRRLFTFTSVFYPLLMAVPVLANVYAKQNDFVAVNLLLGVYVVFGQATQMTFTSVQLLLNSCCQPSAVATVNGMAVAICGIVKSIFPAAINALFALSVSKQLLGGYLSWIVMAGLATGVLVLSFLTPEDEDHDLANKKTRIIDEDVVA